MSTRHSFLITGLAGLAAVAATVVPTTAAAAAPAADLGPRIERACMRIPNIELRTNNLIERLQGDATVRGSLAWLQAQIDRANQRGRTDLATVLENRLAVRTQTLEVLQLRQSELLPSLKEFCNAHGVAV